MDVIDGRNVIWIPEIHVQLMGLKYEEVNLFVYCTATQGIYLHVFDLEEAN
jgi:hypothetical protein